MKFLSLVLASILLSIGCQSKTAESGSTTSAVQKEVNPNEISWISDINQAFAAAKEANKLVFVECYSPTCPTCQSMEPFFKDKEVATFYNQNFVSYKLDVGIAEQVKFLNDNNIFLPTFPQFLYFTPDGKLVHQGDVVNTVASINTAGKIALDETKRASSYAQRFQKGENSLDFLVSYAAFSILAKDTTANLQVANKLFEIYPKDKIGSKESWKITRKCVTDINNGFAKYWFDHVEAAAAFEKEDGHEGLQNNILGAIVQNSLYSKRGLSYNTAELRRIKTLMGKIGAGEYAEGVTWEYEIKALVREKRAIESLAIGERMYTKYKQNPMSIVYITKVFNDVYPDKTYTTTVKKWLDSVKGAIQADKDLAEMYFESARLNQKMGNLPVARQEAQQARDLAIKANTPPDKFLKLVNSL